MEALITILAFVFITGLCIGSFLNVVILRALSNESIVFPASKCPVCQNSLKWWHNIPVISYICLGGKCAFCKEKISIQYPIIELLTGIIFTYLFIKFCFSINTLFYWVVSSVLIVLAGTDIKEKVVFDAHTYTLIGLGLLFSAGYTIYYIVSDVRAVTWLSNPLTMSILGVIAGVVIMELFARAGYLIAGTRAFGEGDTYIAAGLGALFGVQMLILALILSVIIQVILFLPSFIKGLIDNKDWKTLISFVSFCIYAAVFYVMQQNNLIENPIIYMFGALLLAVLGLLSCMFIFKGLRENPSNRTYLPFGPAMVAAAFIIILLFSHFGSQTFACTDKMFCFCACVPCLNMGG